jgi:D-arabinose 1-dehydrogenase-like Zn-dependent alcohol dehydrogenase
MTDTMMALRAHARGGPEQLVYEAAPVPVPGPGGALVAVHAAAITFAELSWDLSWTTRDGRDRTPVIPSHEVSGTVARLGPGADGLTVGEEVYGLIDFDRDGAAAEYVTMPAAHLAARPRSVSDEEAATLPLAALTAWQALVDHAALKPGERVLVQGGAGGVGSYGGQSGGAGCARHVLRRRPGRRGAGEARRAGGRRQAAPGGQPGLPAARRPAGLRVGDQAASPRQNGPAGPLTPSPNRGSSRLRSRKLRKISDNSKKSAAFCS